MDWFEWFESKHVIDKTKPIKGIGLNMLGNILVTKISLCRQLFKGLNELKTRFFITGPTDLKFFKRM